MLTNKSDLLWEDPAWPPLHASDKCTVCMVPLTANLQHLSLVSTYKVCERLSVMHEPAGVVENLVQILQFTPILQYRIPPPPPGNENCQKSWHFDFSVAEYPPQPPPRKLKLRQILALCDFSSADNPPPPKIET